MQYKKTRLTSLFILLPAIVSGGWLVGAENVFAAAASDNYELTIRPSICVTFDSEAPCTMMLNISWAGGSGDAVCLTTATEEAYIQCWNNAVTGNLELPWEYSSNVVYQLVSMQNNQLLASAEVQVISRDLRDSRRRRRHVWSIF